MMEEIPPNIMGGKLWKKNKSASKELSCLVDNIRIEKGEISR